MKKLWWIVILFISSCYSSPDVTLYWKLPILPFQIEFNEQGIHVSGDQSFVTPIGVFGVNITQQLIKFDKRPKQISNIPIAKTDIVVVINKGQKSYLIKIKDNESLKAEIRGSINLEIYKGLVVINISDTSVSSIKVDTQYKKFDKAKGLNKLNRKKYGVVSHSSGILYGATNNGKLYWYKHDGWEDGSYAWRKRPVGLEGWNTFKHLFAGGIGILYGITHSGKLIWYKHKGWSNGQRNWEKSTVGNKKWDSFKQVFCLGQGKIYMVTHSGKLLWYEHKGWRDGTNRWGDKKVIGKYGWNKYKKVFSGGQGIIYAITSDGKLNWYKHKGWLTGSYNWEGMKTVGKKGWNSFLDVFSSGYGVIYAINRKGQLVWRKHNGYKNGAYDWQGPKTVGFEGWKDYY